MMHYQIHWKHEENIHYKTGSLLFELVPLDRQDKLAQRRLCLTTF